jgi:hypothetical protein
MPHAQNRVVPALSPADVGKVLELLAGNGFNLLTAGGSDIELGGEFAFCVGDDLALKALELLRDAGYQTRIVGVDHYEVPNDPGALAEVVKITTANNANSGRKIKDLAIGPLPDSRILVQIFSE